MYFVTKEDLRTLSVLFFVLVSVIPVSGQWIYQNPFTPASPWSETHSVYSQQNSIYPGPYSQELIAVDTILLPPEDVGPEYSVPILTDLYPDGETYCFWFSTGKSIGKVICTYDSLSWIKVNPELYNYKTVCGRLAMDNARKVYALSDYKIHVFRDSIENDPFSPVVLEKIIDLSEFKPPFPDSLWTIKILWSGDILAVSKRGKIFVVKACNFNVKTRDLNEVVYNSAVVEEDGSFYLTTQSNVVKLRWNGIFINDIWTVPTGRSGTTPTLFGIAEPDKYLVIADQNRPFNLILIWRDYIPPDWQGIPGYDLRIAGIQPVTFGTVFPQVDVSPPENSLMVESNNILAVRYDTLYPGSSSFKPGIQKFTWNTQSRLFEECWLNKTIYIPNAMTSLSLPNNDFYGIGERFNGNTKQWTLEGVDWQTGNTSFHVVLGNHDEDMYNITANGIAIGYRGELVTMSKKAILRFRPWFPVSLTEPESVNRIKLYPAPSEDHLNIMISNPSKHQFRIVDMMGICNQDGILTQKLTRLDCSGLKPGLYLVWVEGYPPERFIKK